MPRNPEQNRQIKAERKERILRHALKLFALKGFAATKISDIAKAAGMSQGLVYHYYNSKDAVFTDLIRISYHRMETAARELESLAAPPQEKMRRVVHGMVRSIEQSREVGYRFLLLSQAAVSTAIPDDARAIIAAKGRVHYTVVQNILEKGIEEGSVKPFDAKDLTLMLWTAVNGLAVNKAIHGPGFKAPDPDILMGMIFK